MNNQIYSDFGIDQAFHDWLDATFQGNREHVRRHPEQLENAARSSYWVRRIKCDLLEGVA